MKTIQDLEQEPDKMEIFRDFERIKEYVVTIKDLIDAILTLEDSQKLEVIRLEYCKKILPERFKKTYTK